MNTFQITSDVLKKVWNSSDELLYSVKDGKVYNACDFADVEGPAGFSQSQYFLNLGYIPFASVSNNEVLRAYAQTINNSKIKESIEQTDDDLYTDVFWKYFNLYPDMLEEYKNFEEKYVLNKVEKWCIDNGLKYEIS